MLTFQDITNIYDLIEEKNKNKTQRIFSEYISHELISPLADIVNFAEECLKM